MSEHLEPAACAINFTSPLEWFLGLNGSNKINQNYYLKDEYFGLCLLVPIVSIDCLASIYLLCFPSDLVRGNFI